MWCTWTPHNPAAQWAEYTWDKPITLNGARIYFWADHPAGANEGVAPPKAWHLDYWDGTNWKPVVHAGAYTTTVDEFNTVSFDAVTTTRLRATFDASGDDKQHAAIAVEEWEALKP